MIELRRPVQKLDAWLRGHLSSALPAGLTSLCSAHKLVLETAMRQATEEETALLIEATCNQVNHERGYTGLTPAAFYGQVHTIAEEVGFPTARLLLGGDHPGRKPVAAATGRAS